MPVRNQKKFVILTILGAIVFSTPAQAEVYLQDKLQMIYDYMGINQYKNVWVPTVVPSQLYLSHIYLNYDSRRSENNQIDFKVLYKERHYSESTRLWLKNSTPFPVNNQCPNGCYAVKEIDHSLTFSKINFCYSYSQLGSDYTHFVDHFMSNEVIGENLNASDFWSFIQNLAPITHFGVKVKKREHKTLNRLKNTLQYFQLGNDKLWFIENYLLNNLNYAFYLPNYLPGSMFLSKFDMGFYYSQEDSRHQTYSNFPAYVFYQYESSMNKNKFVQFVYKSLDNCNDLNIYNPKTLYYRTKKLGNAMICTNPEKLNSQDPEQKKMYYLGVPGMPFQLRSQNLELKELLKIADSLNRVK